MWETWVCLMVLTPDIKIIGFDIISPDLVDYQAKSKFWLLPYSLNDGNLASDSGELIAESLQRYSALYSP